ncbi:hypothetical protein [Mucilaginibacter psychrotolerans]|uniref:MAE-28990/MAE-18760-like HEPN domain-containing protein n=1 Tax=Mucilaginibacter psychrotolerans TaxID=1524096 RepID=A0A4Y8SGH2_9SPHI|nr:hypothetical protein [Mucilaginibacter psychrotolerans]TFF37647.1 hypothetical protein E2R66_10780 [Mucilaginibacter psychrotolerans]
MDRHRDFILSPVTGLLKEVVAANIGIGDGMETYPLSEYIFQSVFLKMTGFQEQKMKCIVWDLATDDYDYRYKRYSQSTLGECSSYEDKKKIFLDLVELITKYETGFDVNTGIDKAAIQNETITEVKTLFSGSNLATWAQNNFLEFMGDNAIIPLNQFATTGKLFENVLQSKYNLLYYHRNRCAHNTFSYQENLPTLNTLLKSNPKDDNYFVRFTLLVLLDKIFIALYTKYKLLFEEN